MKLHNLLLKTILLCLVLIFPVSQAAAKDAWTKARSKNFNLFSDDSETDIREATFKLESFRKNFQQIFGNVKFDSRIPLNVVVFKNRQSLLNFGTINKSDAKSESSGNDWQNEESVNYLAFSVESEKPEENLRAFFHEYVHFLVNENLGRSMIQPWFNEGLAEYLETAQIGNDGLVALGKQDSEHLLVLRQNKLIPLDVFFEMDYYSLQKQGEHGKGLFYAQSWAFMHYLMRSENTERDSQFNKFIELLLNGKRQKYAFEEAFQTDYQTLEIELKKYVEQKSFRADSVTLKNKFAADYPIQISPATEAESKIVLGNLLYQSNCFQEAAILLEEAAKFDSVAGEAHSLLGLVKFRQGETDEAVKHLERAIALDEKNYLAHYRYAYVLSREGMTDYGFVSNYTAERAERIRVALDKSIALEPNFAESYNLYAFIAYVRNEAIDRAIERIEKALKIAHGNQRFQMRLAELSSLKEDFGKAQHLARKIFESAPDERLRVYAKNAIYRIDTYESQIESLKNPFRKRLHEVTDKPLTEEESARLNWLAMLEGINQNLRRLQQNEKRVLGYLTRVECGANKIEYSVKTDNQTLTLSSDSFDTLKLVTFSAEERGGQISCGMPGRESFAVIGYRPSMKDDAKSAGEILSIEFVPKNFKFLY